MIDDFLEYLGERFATDINVYNYGIMNAVDDFIEEYPYYNKNDLLKYVYNEFIPLMKENIKNDKLLDMENDFKL